jgi:hypothetical protein
LRTTATTVRTTGKDDDDSKDDDSKDCGDNNEDDNNDGGNNDSSGSGGGKIGGEVGGVARSVAWLVAVFFTIGCLALTYHRNCTDMFGNKFTLGYKGAGVRPPSGNMGVYSWRDTSDLKIKVHKI